MKADLVASEREGGVPSDQLFGQTGAGSLALSGNREG